MGSAGYVVSLMKLGNSSRMEVGSSSLEAEDMRGVKDWRVKTSSPLTYRIGVSTLHFRSHLMLAIALCCAAFLVLAYIALTGNTRSLHEDGKHFKLHREGLNFSYPNTKGERVEGGGVRWKFMVVEDPDERSKLEDGKSWGAHIRYGSLLLKSIGGRKRSPTSAEVTWDNSKEGLLKSNLAAGGRGMELSELVWFNGAICTVDDRTGVVYKISEAGVVPWVILGDGDGNRLKGLKGEWMAVKDGDLWVGGLGKEWTTRDGQLASYDPMWVKVIGSDGQVQHVDWREQFLAVRSAAGVEWPGYMIHEAVQWSEIRKQWVFLPRRLGKHKYDDVTDERRGTNVMITADAKFEDIKVSELGPLIPTRGFSSFKFVPGTEDSVLIALKSEEVEGQLATYITVLTTDNKVLLPETKFADAKFEGIEFV